MMYAVVVLLSLLTMTIQQQEDVDYEPLPDYYATLNVSPTAKLNEIKKSFRKLAMQYHPDKNKDEGAQERFQELSEAYSILSDSEKRKEYDELYMDDGEFFEEEAPEESFEYDSGSEFHKGDFSYGNTEEGVHEDIETEEEDSDAEEDLWADLDDETLFKVLKYLSDNEYEISKKTTRVPDQYPRRQQAEFDQFARYTSSSSENSYRYDSTYRAYEAPSFKWSRDAQENVYDHASRRYASRPHTSGFCRTTIRWEGDAKVTSRSCY